MKHFQHFLPLALVPLAACAALPAPARAPQPLGEASQFTIYAGQRDLDSGDYAPVDEQGTLGASVSWPVNQGDLRGEFGALFSHDDASVGPYDVDGRTSELFGGVRHNFGGENLIPYLGGGLSLIKSEVEVSPGGSDDDGSFGLYVHAGVDAWVTEQLAIGVDYRVLFGTDMEIAGVSTDADYDQLALTLSFSF